MKIVRFERMLNEDVKQVCIENSFYTCGNNTEYDNMFSMVDRYNYQCDTQSKRDKMLYNIANDIYNHSSKNIQTDWSVEDIMWLFNKKVIFTTFSIQ